MRPILSLVVLGLWLVAPCAHGQPAPREAPLPDKDWKRWLDQVRPLLLVPDLDEIKLSAPSQRRQFQEDFWLARDPDPATPDNEVRAEYERRVLTAEKRFRVDGKLAWNDCGRTFLLLGQPDWMRNDHGVQHFGSPDPLRSFSEQENVATERWLYRGHPRLPASPEGYAFRFNPGCEAVASPSSERLLQAVAESYVRAKGSV
jgi:GWxTD domain-containing protein